MNNIIILILSYFTRDLRFTPFSGSMIIYWSQAKKPVGSISKYRKLWYHWDHKGRRKSSHRYAFLAAIAAHQQIRKTEHILRRVCN